MASTPDHAAAVGATPPPSLLPTPSELKVFYTEFALKKYDAFWAQVGQEMSKTPLGQSDFDPKNNISVASLRRKLMSLKIRILPLARYAFTLRDYASVELC